MSACYIFVCQWVTLKNDRMTNKKGKIKFHGEDACEAVFQ